MEKGLLNTGGLAPFSTASQKPLGSAFRKWSQAPFIRASIPSDFDLVRYFILNPEVLRSTDNPIKHYTAYGRSEGRIYKSHVKYPQK